MYAQAARQVGVVGEGELGDLVALLHCDLLLRARRAIRNNIVAQSILARADRMSPSGRRWPSTGFSL